MVLLKAKSYIFTFTEISKYYCICNYLKSHANVNFCIHFIKTKKKKNIIRSNGPEEWRKKREQKSWTIISQILADAKNDSSIDIRKGIKEIETGAGELSIARLSFV